MDLLKKVLVLFLIIILATLLAGVYGIANDQLTYTISPEYYTKFKFIQFGLVQRTADGQVFPEIPNIPIRLAVGVVGFLATWWVGLLIGLVLGFTGLIHKTAGKMLGVTMKAFAITLLIAFLTAVAGLLYGKFYLVGANPDWYFPDNLMNKNNFIIVGSMHNFSYLGGLLGLAGGIAYSIRKKFAAAPSKV